MLLLVRTGDVELVVRRTLNRHNGAEVGERRWAQRKPERVHDEGTLCRRMEVASPIARRAMSVYIAPSLSGPIVARDHGRWALSSAVEHYLDMVGVRGSIPLAPTISSLLLRLTFAPVLGHSRETTHLILYPCPPTHEYTGFIADDGVHQGETIESRLGAYEPRRRRAAHVVARFRGRISTAGRREGQARRLGDPLRNSPRRGPRAMRDRAQRRRPGPAEPDSGRDRAQYRGSEDAPHAGHCAARGAASPRRKLADRQRGGGALKFPAMSSEWLRRPIGHGPSLDR